MNKLSSILLQNHRKLRIPSAGASDFLSLLILHLKRKTKTFILGAHPMAKQQKKN